ncbi:hypothetical protein R1sor_004078 [Riccia sorocarpa]|uniref:FCP1 homology domain-containing protein n=1 Tax=Riccia sorocarpa TaxID=122646 RepID=A0ABD3H5M4_9MARC
MGSSGSEGIDSEGIAGNNAIEDIDTDSSEHENNHRREIRSKQRAEAPRKKQKSDETSKSLVDFEILDDPNHHLKWGHFSQETVMRVLDNWDGEDWDKLQLFSTFSIHFPRPEVSACLQFIQSYDSSTKTRTVGKKYYQLNLKRKHVQKEKPIRLALTFLGQVLTWLFLYKGLIPVVRPEPPIKLLAPPLSPQPPTGGETESSQVHILDFKPTLLHPTEPRQKILILALDGILCCVRDRQTKYLEAGILGWPILEACDIWICPRSGLSHFLEQVLQNFTLIIWSDRPESVTEFILKTLEDGGFLPTGKVFHDWNQDKCEKAEPGQALAESGGTFWMKDFHHLYDWNVCTRDVLLIDEYVSANALNHPYNAVHPEAFQPSFLAPENDIFLVQNLLPWLQTWNASPAPTTDYVRENYKTLTTRGAMEGIKFLAIEKILRLVGCLWRNVSVHEQKILVAKANANQPSTATAPSASPVLPSIAQSDSSPPTTRRDTQAPSLTPSTPTTGRAATGRGKGRSSASRASTAGRGRGTQEAGKGTKSNFARCSGIRESKDFT